MSKKIIILILIIALFIVGSLGTGFYLLINKISMLETRVQTVAPVENEEDEEILEEPDKTIGLIYPLETFVVNLADKKQRFIRVTISLEYELKDHLEKIEERIPQIKDAILTLIPTKTSEELNMVDGKNDLREGLKAQLNTFFNEEVITSIYFTEFVIQ